MEIFLKELLKNALGGENEAYRGSAGFGRTQNNGSVQGYAQTQNNSTVQNYMQGQGSEGLQDSSAQGSLPWGSMPQDSPAQGSMLQDADLTKEGSTGAQGGFDDVKKVAPEDEMMPDVEHGGELLKTLTKGSASDSLIKAVRSRHITLTEARRGIVLAEILGPPRSRRRIK